MDKLKEYITLIMDKFTDNKKLIIICLVLVGIIIFAGSIQASDKYQTHGRGGWNEQPAGQTQEQSSVNANSNVNISKSGSRSSSNAGAISNSGGNRISSGGGRSESSSSATGGTSTATGGVGLGGVGIGGKVGDTSSSSGGNEQVITVEGDTDSSESTLIYEGDEHTASSAASVYAGYCQTGGSGQTESGGFAVINSDQFCDHVRAAQVMLTAYKEAISHCRCEGVCTTELASVEMVCEGDNKEQANFYLAAYHENMKDAHNMVQNTQATGLIGRISGQLAIPAALIAALFIL